jgi:hypothetical protein
MNAEAHHCGVVVLSLAVVTLPTPAAFADDAAWLR